ncbi:MAG: nucleotide exchange factor GrpE [Bdellovibrionaceae bacterium]|nr:nucleotide exchange factor GrpE [Pseudobdellovibrionaceae bacterium]|tara:strand:+ start:396 stop:917 length:522 start_codon:yes stop_codon:yes gene_type:complete
MSEELKNENTETSAETTSENDTPDFEEQLKQAKQDYLYLAADFENYKKNAIKERSELVKFGNERVLRDLLEVMDNMERALIAHTGEETKESLASGVEMIVSEMRGLLQKFGVKEVNCEGKAFDPNMHEALSSEPTDKVPNGHITQVFKKAYTYNDRLLRPAQVVVATEPKEKG